jgi:hypothetical protein
MPCCTFFPPGFQINQRPHSKLRPILWHRASGLWRKMHSWCQSATRKMSISCDTIHLSLQSVSAVACLEWSFLDFVTMQFKKPRCCRTKYTQFSASRASNQLWLFLFHLVTPIYRNGCPSLIIYWATSKRNSMIDMGSRAGRWLHGSLVLMASPYY